MDITELIGAADGDALLVLLLEAVCSYKGAKIRYGSQRKQTALVNAPPA